MLDEPFIRAVSTVPRLTLTFSRIRAAELGKLLQVFKQSKSRSFEDCFQSVDRSRLLELRTFFESAEAAERYCHVYDSEVERGRKLG